MITGVRQRKKPLLRAILGNWIGLFNVTVKMAESPIAFATSYSSLRRLPVAEAAISDAACSGLAGKPRGHYSH
jgi:hypothetical protein